MKRILKIALIVIPILIIVFVVVVAMQPDTFSVSRSATIAAPPEVVFPHVNTLKLWDAWSPWAKLDPNSTATFEGPESGTGAAMSWAGNNEVGEGKMTITDSRAPELIRFHLVFYKPMAGESDTEFTFKPEGAGTTVTWTMMGNNDFIGRAVCLFMDMDKMLGGQFEQGLAAMKSVVEAEAKK